MMPAKKPSISQLLATKGQTLIGPIPEENRKAILAYLQNPAPTHADWVYIRGMIITTDLRKATLWSIITVFDPACPISSDQHDSYTPNPLTLARAIKHVLTRGEKS